MRTAVKYKITPVNSNFLFSLRSMIWPAYSDIVTAGITSDKPIKPIAKGSLVKLYIHQPTTVLIILKPIINVKRPAIRLRYSAILTAAKGSVLFIIFYLLMVNSNSAVHLHNPYPAHQSLLLNVRHYLKNQI